MDSSADQHLITQTLSGNTQAFGGLVEKYQDFVFTVVLRMVKVREEAEEIAQDTFIKAFESLKSFRGESKFSSWLYSIAYRKALDSLRKKKRQLTSELIEDITEGEVEVVDNALHYLEEKEKKVMIRDRIAMLPEQDAALITFYYYEELSVKEIAGITQLTEDNIKIKLYRSRKKLFTLMKDLVLPELNETNGKAI